MASPSPERKHRDRNPLLLHCRDIHTLLMALVYDPIGIKWVSRVEKEEETYEGKGNDSIHAQQHCALKIIRSAILMQN